VASIDVPSIDVPSIDVPSIDVTAARCGRATGVPVSSGWNFV
jgi:hypothetical protein